MGVHTVLSQGLPVRLVLGHVLANTACCLGMAAIVMHLHECVCVCVTMYGHEGVVGMPQLLQLSDLLCSTGLPRLICSPDMLCHEV